jgi:hypothetical protein
MDEGVLVKKIPLQAMIGKNRHLVTNEPVEIEK